MARTWQQLQRELEELEASMTDEQLDAVEAVNTIAETARVKKENRRESARQGSIQEKEQKYSELP